VAILEWQLDTLRVYDIVTITYYEQVLVLFQRMVHLFKFLAWWETLHAMMSSDPKLFRPQAIKHFLSLLRDLGYKEESTSFDSIKFHPRLLNGFSSVFLASGEEKLMSLRDTVPIIEYMTLDQQKIYRDIMAQSEDANLLLDYDLISPLSTNKKEYIKTYDQFRISIVYPDFKFDNEIKIEFHNQDEQYRILITQLKNRKIDLNFFTDLLVSHSRDITRAWTIFFLERIHKMAHTLNTEIRIRLDFSSFLQTQIFLSMIQILWICKESNCAHHHGNYVSLLSLFKLALEKQWRQMTVFYKLSSGRLSILM
jgi:hypothetical protein